MASLTTAVEFKKVIKVSWLKIYYICSLNLRVPQRCVETILRVGGEDLICLSILFSYRRDLCFIYTRQTEVLQRNYHKHVLQIFSGYVGGK
jgi:hypothetical protein